MNNPERKKLAELARWARRELLEDILPFWARHARDASGEGFLGEILPDSSPVPEADRSVVMVARHLWIYAAASRVLADPKYLLLASEAYAYLRSRFYDPTHGGFHWTVSRTGRPVITKKQIYGQVFAIYGLGEYARAPTVPASLRDEALALAAETVALLEKHALDEESGGYVEALSPEWLPTADRALSPVDMDCDKSMNTNLHTLEAYTNLYRVVPSKELRRAIVSLLGVHAEHIAQDSGHLGLFFRADWSRMDEKVSFGHDIEASWLMEESVEVLESEQPGDECEKTIFAAVHSAADHLARAVLAEGFDAISGGLDDEAESAVPGAPRNGRRIWWCQAEALVGFVSAWERSSDDRFLDAALAVRDYIDAVILDKVHGEWHGGADLSGHPIAISKGGNWKTGYHTGRACMELIRRSAQAE